MEGMASLLSCLGISKAYGSRPLFQNFTLHLAEGDRLGLIGRNGSGKSTLLAILAGLETADTGEVVRRKGVRAGYVAQETEFAAGETVWSALEAGIAPLGLEELERDRRLHMVLGKVGFTDPAQEARLLSGGWQKRLAIAAQVVAQPDLLLLDEPTNHLDMEGIEWLESFLASEAPSYVVVSHDRYFLENVAREMAELGRNFPDGIFRAPGNYSVFLEKREEFLRGQASYEDSLANRVRTEMEWLRRGPKARATKAKARIDNAYRLIDELETTRTLNRGGAAQIDFESTDRQTKRLLEARELSKAYDGNVLFRDLSFLLGPRMRLGLVGANGSGKTTLLRILLGQETADAGSVRQADFLKPVYFDQRREQLNPQHSLREALGAHEDLILYRDKSIHVAAWAQRFLFDKEQLQSPVGSLSGGEHARLLVARLMLDPADLLLLDEPTNDLDIPTLEVLEESLLEFPGALILITHDRFLLDRVSTQVLGLFGEGEWGLFADYWQWRDAVREREQVRRQATARAVEAVAKSAANTGGGSGTRAQKLSYKEQREWEGMEERIHEAEARLAVVETQLSDAAVLSDGARVTALLAEQETLQREVERLYERWGELEAKQAPVAG
jgi:ATP-binding cassette subfamily F protein uup